MQVWWLVLLSQHQRKWCAKDHHLAEPEQPAQTTRAPSFVSWAEEVAPQASETDVKESKVKPSKSRLTMRVPWELEKTKVDGVKEILAQVTRKQTQGNSSVEHWPAWRRIAQRIVVSPTFEWFCASLILLCAMLIGVEAHWSIQNIHAPGPEVFQVLNTGFNLLFTVELVLRVMVEGVLFLSWHNPSIHWNVMDAGLVTVALVEEVILLVAVSTESIDLSGFNCGKMTLGSCFFSCDLVILHLNIFSQQKVSRLTCQA